MSYAQKIAFLDEIRVIPGSRDSRHIRGTVRLISNGQSKDFELIFTYSDDISVNENIAGLILATPVINFTLFAKKFVLDFPVSDSDMDFVSESVRINNREVFINKLVRRRYEFFKKEFLPAESEVTAENVDGVTEVNRTQTFQDKTRSKTKGNAVAVLSSGGKESLLSYGLLREAGSELHAFYFNESGSHWFTAKTAYAYYKKNFQNIHKVWSNVDRFYRFFLRNMEIIDQAVIKRKTDTYPVQLYIFPVYVMSMLPLSLKYGISSAVLGDEFDDPREMPDYKGFKHYFGIYDQSHDFNRGITGYFHTKGIDFSIWSAVYPISGSVVEKILSNRYSELFRLQRSCHSCRSINGKMVPCGRCSKCLGIIMFTLAAGGRPQDILYSDDSVGRLQELVANERMRLDSDELNLMKYRLHFSELDPTPLLHMEGMHILPDEKFLMEKMPEHFRDKIQEIFSEYTDGTYSLQGMNWVPTDIRRTEPQHK